MREIFKKKGNLNKRAKLIQQQKFPQLLHTRLCHESGGSQEMPSSHFFLPSSIIPQLPARRGARCQPMPVWVSHL